MAFSGMHVKNTCKNDAVFFITFRYQYRTNKKRYEKRIDNYCLGLGCNGLFGMYERLLL